jgi:hypothetical protein
LTLGITPSAPIATEIDNKVAGVLDNDMKSQALPPLFCTAGGHRRKSAAGMMTAEAVESEYKSVKGK